MPRPFPPRALRAALTLLLLTACSAPLEPSAAVSPGPASGEALAVEAGDNFFEPRDIRVEPGRPVTVEITNTGRRPHDWTVEELDLTTGTMAPGEVVHATFDAPEEPVQFVCTLHRGMTGSFELT